MLALPAVASGQTPGEGRDWPCFTGVSEIRVKVFIVVCNHCSSPLIFVLEVQIILCFQTRKWAHFLPHLQDRETLSNKERFPLGISENCGLLSELGEPTREQRCRLVSKIMSLGAQELVPVVTHSGPFRQLLATPFHPQHRPPSGSKARALWLMTFAAT